MTLAGPSTPPGTCYTHALTKFLHDRGHIGFDEPFKGRSTADDLGAFQLRVPHPHRHVCDGPPAQGPRHPAPRGHQPLDNDKLDLEGSEPGGRNTPKPSSSWKTTVPTCGHEVEKMSKSKYNVQTPDDLVERYGADTLRYEMFWASDPAQTVGHSGHQRGSQFFAQDTASVHPSSRRRSDACRSL